MIPSCKRKHSGARSRRGCGRGLPAWERDGRSWRGRMCAMTQVDPKIVEAKRKAEADLLKLPGVTGVDIGFKEVAGQPTDQVAIRVLVEEKKDVPKGQHVHKEIEGIPTDVIQRKFELHQMA